MARSPPAAGTAHSAAWADRSDPSPGCTSISARIHCPSRSRRTRRPTSGCRSATSPSAPNFGSSRDRHTANSTSFPVLDCSTRLGRPARRRRARQPRAIRRAEPDATRNGAHTSEIPFSGGRRSTRRSSATRLVPASIAEVPSAVAQGRTQKHAASVDILGFIASRTRDVPAPASARNTDRTWERVDACGIASGAFPIFTDASVLAATRVLKCILAWRIGKRESAARCWRHRATQTKHLRRR